MSIDHKRVYEEERLWSWYFVLVIEDFGSLIIHDFPVPPCPDHYLLDVLISLEEPLFWWSYKGVSVRAAARAAVRVAVLRAPSPG